jgi:hypothetical protein
MFATELDTFVQKFHQLWNNGYVAHLDVDTCAGKAWVGLRVDLGHVPGPLHHRQPHPAYHNRKKVDSPSRQRRRAARAVARAQLVNAEQESDPETVEETGPTKDVEETLSDTATATETVGSEAVDEIVNESDDKLDEIEVDKEFNDEPCVAEEATELDTTESAETNTETTEKGIDKVLNENVETNDGDETPNENATEEAINMVAAVPTIAVVHATAIFEDCPSSVVTQDEIDSLVRFLTSKDHLSRNIDNIVYNVLSSREFRNERFKHTVQVQLNVKTANLWESARGYIWKHLGADSWTRGNGTRMTLVRIHQKT